MQKGDIYQIHYCEQNKNITATFMEEFDGIYFFEDIHGRFGVTKRKIENKEIILEPIEDTW